MWFSRYKLPNLRLEGEKIYLRPPRMQDFEAWRQVRAENRAFLKPWEPTWPQDALTHRGFKRKIAHQVKNWRSNRGYAFLMFLKDTDELIGGINLNHVTEGVSKMAALGYWLAEPHTGRGHMQDAITVMIHHSFYNLGLHRLEASCLLNNNASMRTLRNCGFSEEGKMRKYIKINGRWQDHILYGIVREDLEVQDKILPWRQVA